MYIDEDTFVVQLTVGQLVSYLKKSFRMLAEEPKADKAEPEVQVDGPTFAGRLAYGIVGIERVFGVSHKTAQQWKDGWMKPAVRQNGRKIVTDVAYAMKLLEDQEKAKKLGKKGR